MGDAATYARLLRDRARAGLWLPVSGRSMAPRLVPPARVHVMWSDAPPRVAEIWAFVNSRGDLVVHRCAGRRDGRRVFVGDANPGRDELVDDDLLVGRITMVHSGAARRRPTRLAGLAPLLGWSGRSVLRRVMRHHAE